MLHFYTSILLAITVCMPYTYMHLFNVYAKYFHVPCLMLASTVGRHFTRWEMKSLGNVTM